MASTECTPADSAEDRYEPASHVRRALAWLIDAAIVFCVFAFLPQPVSVLLFLALFVAYHAALIWLTGQTVGKVMFGLRVKRIGRKPGFLWATGRPLLGYFIVDLFGLGLLLAVFDRHNRCLHDLVFGSLVVSQDSGSWHLQTLLTRLLDHAERQRAAVDQKKKAVATLATLWAFLIGMGRGIKNVLDSLGGASAGTSVSGSAPSMVGALTLKAATSITIAAAVVTTAVVVFVPAVRDTAQWLIQPRYIFTQRPGILPVDDFVLAQFDLRGDVLVAGLRRNQWPNWPGIRSH